MMMMTMMMMVDGGDIKEADGYGGDDGAPIDEYFFEREARQEKKIIIH